MTTALLVLLLVLRNDYVGLLHELEQRGLLPPATNVQPVAALRQE